MDGKPGRWLGRTASAHVVQCAQVHLSHPLDSLRSALQPSVGQVARVDVSSKVEVVWADNSKTIILPQVRLAKALALAPRGTASLATCYPSQVCEVP